MADECVLHSMPSSGDSHGPRLLLGRLGRACRQVACAAASDVHAEVKSHGDHDLSSMHRLLAWLDRIERLPGFAALHDTPA